MQTRVDPSNTTAADVLRFFHYEKNRQRKLHGLSEEDSEAFLARASRVLKTPAEKCAAVCRSCNYDPALVLEATFAYARSMRHPNGPMPNMLGSHSYIMKALSFHLDLPYEVVGEKFSKEHIIASMDAMFEKTAKTLDARVRNRPNKEISVGEYLSMQSSIDPVFLLAYAPTCPIIIQEFADEVIEAMVTERAKALFLEDRGLDSYTISRLMRVHGS